MLGKHGFQTPRAWPLVGTRILPIARDLDALTIEKMPERSIDWGIRSTAVDYLLFEEMDLAMDFLYNASLWGVGQRRKRSDESSR